MVGPPKNRPPSKSLKNRFGNRLASLSPPNPALRHVSLDASAYALRNPSTRPSVRPGGESLLRLSSWPKVEKVLQAIDAIEALGIDPADAAPEYWRHVHNHLSVGEQPRPYTRSRHLAWLHRQAISS